MKREGLKFSATENYYPFIMKAADRPSAIHEEVLRHYGANSGEGFSKSAQGSIGLGGISGVGGNIMATIPMMYLPEFASPDRLFYPSDIKLAKKYWRYFYTLDPVCGNIIDMYSEMMMSDVELIGESLSKEIKETCENALDATQALGMFRWMAAGFLVDGEVVPHLVWDDDENRWMYLGFQDPMNINVIDVPFIGTEPYVEMEIPPAVKKILMDPDPKFNRFRENVPQEVLTYAMEGKPIPLNTEENVTFIPRRLTPYDTRGVSVFSRLWRVFMYEDAIFNASIQTARRHAAPVKVIKMGNPATGWIPGPEHAEKLKQLLAACETDPHAWLIYHFGISFEAWGTTDRVMTIDKQWETIERIKLIALGASKAFLTGEVTYASAEKGLQVFLARLNGLRTFFMERWWYPRFFGVMAKKNEWIKPTQAEISHRVRTKRSKREKLYDRQYIIPEMVWEKTLDPQSKDDKARLMAELKERLGITISKSTASAQIGIDWEAEELQVREEAKISQKMDEQYGVQAPPPEGGSGGGGGGGGGIGAPPAPAPEEGTEGMGEEGVPSPTELPTEELGGTVEPPPGEK